MTYEKPKTEDIPDLIPLWEEQYRFHHQIDPEYYVDNSPELKQKFVDYLTKIINENQTQILIAKDDGKIVGFITFLESYDTYLDTKITKFGLIIELFVAEDYRKQGIGSELMGKAEEYFKIKGLPYVTLHVSCFNDEAIEYYHKRNYTNSQMSMIKKLRL